MSDFLTWLISEAGAGWVFGVVSLLTLVLSLLSRSRGRHVVFRDLETASWIDIRKEVRDRIKISYDGRDIRALGFIQGELFNPGLDVIKDCRITLSVRAPAQIIDVVAASSLDDCILATTIQDRVATVTIPFLNPYRGHRHTVVVATTYDGNPADVAIAGSGAGWSLKRIGILGSPIQRGKIIIPTLTFVVFLLIVRFWYQGWLEQNYGIGQDEISVRGFVAALPFLLGMIFFIGWMHLSSRVPKPKSAKETLDKIKSS